MNRIALMAVVCLAGLAMTASPARSHDQPFSYADVRLAPNGLELRLALHRLDAAGALAGAPTPEALTSEQLLARYADPLSKAVAARVHLTSDGRMLALEPRGSAVDPERAQTVAVVYRAAWTREPGRLHVRVDALSPDEQHETYLNVYQGEKLLRQDVLTATHHDTDVFTTGRQGLLAVLGIFTGAGIHHIFIGPDHILFIIGLLLLGGGIGRILKIVTGFTLAHSITLALATLGIVNPPARIIEPLIALSVLYVGVDNLRTKRGPSDYRALIAFGFGFIHGFGFAGVLREFGLPQGALGVSLFAFNVGVEIGQMCIVLAITPLLGLLRARTPQLAMRVARAASWGVVIAGGWWFVTRALRAG